MAFSSVLFLLYLWYGLFFSFLLFLSLVKAPLTYFLEACLCWFFFLSLGETKSLEGNGRVKVFEKIFNFHHENLVEFWMESSRECRNTPQRPWHPRVSPSFASPPLASRNLSTSLLKCSYYFMASAASAPGEQSWFLSPWIHQGDSLSYSLTSLMVQKN